MNKFSQLKLKIKKIIFKKMLKFSFKRIKLSTTNKKKSDKKNWNFYFRAMIINPKIIIALNKINRSLNY